ncbi:MAG: type II secretion system F family protein [Patescibacteria group bacterium]|nr:type II secretion system F family protein [Patescibacteria group bacterium]MCX7589747.1 type II secretion system F family protein [Patescibacteria group bacterium]MDW8279649.1 type II secretion system F family protein [bacterium]
MFLNKVKIEEKMFLAKYLALILKAGLPITKGFEMLIKQSQNKYLKKCLKNILEDITSGKLMSESLEKYPKIFDNLFVNMIRSAETAGNLEEVLDILAEELKKTGEFRSKIRGAMIYPIIIISMMILITNFMVFFIFPKILNFYSSLNVKIPGTAKILINIVKFSTSNIFYILGGSIIIIFLFFIWSKTKKGKRFVDWLVINLPILKNISKKVYTIQFLRTFSSLLKSGIPTPKALEITATTINSSYYRESILNFSEGIRQGKKLSEMVEKYNIYPPITSEIINVGEETGQLSYMLKQLYEFIEAEVNDILDNLSKIIEPILMIILAIIVGFIAVATVQLIYASVQMVQN